MRTYLITGAAGFVGNNLIRLINREQPHARVRALVRSNPHPASLAGLACDIFVGDITKPGTLEAFFDVGAGGAADSAAGGAARTTDGAAGGASDAAADDAERTTDAAADEVFVIHCAGVIDIGSKRNPAVHEVDVQGTVNVAEAAMRLARTQSAPVRFMHIGSVHALPEKPRGQQISEVGRFDAAAVVGQYAKAKAEAAQYVLDRMREGTLSGCVLLPSGIIGPFNFGPENMKELVFKTAKGTLSACVTGGYDFVDVRDVAAGILSACERGRDGESYILSNRSVPIKEICDEVCAFVGRPPIKVVLPAALARAGAPLCELYYRLRKQVPLFTAYALYTLQSNSDFSHEKATRELGYATRPVQDTVFDMVAWMETQPSWDKA